jgi:hypothetical protein
VPLQKSDKIETNTDCTGFPAGKNKESLLTDRMAERICELAKIV